MALVAWLGLRTPAPAAVAEAPAAVEAENKSLTVTV